MLNGKILLDRSSNVDDDEEYNFCKIDKVRKFIVRWSPPEDTKCFSKNFASPRALSKSVPRRNKSLIRYRINRSLNFEVTSPFSEGRMKSGTSCDGDMRLGRSAKIMDALNFSRSPRSGKKINKSLDFSASTPNKKKLEKQNFQSPRNLSRLVLKPSKLSFTPKMQCKKNSPRFLDVSPRDGSILSQTSKNLFDDFNEAEDDDGDEMMEEMGRWLSPDASPIVKQKSLSRQSDPQTPKENTSIEEPGAKKEKQAEEKSPLTPPMNSRASTPRYDVDSIKVSHKKDKSQKKPSFCHSEDEVSETGSIFDYSEEQKNPNNFCSNERLLELDESLDRNSDSRQVEDADGSETGSIFDYSEEQKKLEDSVLDGSIQRRHLEFDESLEADPVDQNLENPENVSSTPSRREDARIPVIRVEGATETGSPKTPENRMEHLRRALAGESIKRSHKKMKEENKKKIFKPRVLEIVANPSEGSETPEKNVERAGTPENVNSSRLLLPQFSSVKKSHKKDKHKTAISGHLKRQQFFQRLSDENDFNDIRSFATPLKKKDDVAGSSAEYDDAEEDDPRPIDESPKSSPTMKDRTTSLEYESAEEEFQIFTPIKKRKSIGGQKRLSTDQLEISSGGSPREISNTVENFRTPDKCNRVQTRTSTPNGRNEEPVPSTSRGIEDNSNVKTPPNDRMNILIYANLTRTHSIKRSHKKVRESRRFHMERNRDKKIGD